MNNQTYPIQNKMDLNTYLAESIIYTIYAYIGWHALRYYQHIPDTVWSRLCDDYREDSYFNVDFSEYWKSDRGGFTAKEQFFLYVNSKIPAKYSELSNSIIIPPILLCDKNFILLCLTSVHIMRSNHCTRVFQYLHQKWRYDRDIVLAAVHILGIELEHADMRFRSDREIVLTAVKSLGEALQYANLRFRSDRQIVTAAVRSQGYALQYADETLKNDRDIVLTAINNDARSFRFAGIILKQDRNFILEIIPRNPKILKWVHNDLKNDYEIGLLAVMQNGWLIEHLSPTLKLNRNIVLSAIKSQISLHRLEPIWRQDREIVSIFVGWDPEYFTEADPILQKDKIFVSELMHRHIDVLQWSSEELKADRELVTLAIRQNFYQVFDYIHPDLLNDKRFMLSMIQYNAHVLKKVSSVLQHDPEFLANAQKYHTSFWGNSSHN